MDDETRAQRLAAWLNSPASTEPPEDLDPEVLGAVYALAPDRAPAPRVDIDDILSLVTEGPFKNGSSGVADPTSFDPTTGTVVEFPKFRVPAPKMELEAPSDLEMTEIKPPEFVEETEVMSPAEAAARFRSVPGGKKVDAAPPPPPRAPLRPARREEPARRPSRAWMMPTIGLALAAAAATLVIVPTMRGLDAPDRGELDGRQEMVAAAPPSAAPAAPGAIAEMGPPGAGEAPAPEEEKAAPVAPRGGAGEAQIAAGNDLGADGADRAAGGLGTVTKSPAEPEPRRVAEAAEGVKKEAPELAATEAGARAPASGVGSASSTSQTAAPIQSQTGGYVADAEPAPPPAAAAPAGAPAPSTSRSSAPAKRDSYIPEAGPVMEREAEDDSLKDARVFEDADEESLALESTKASRSSSAGRSKPKASAPASSSAPAADTSNVVTPSARASATPLDHGAFSPPADVAAAFEAARADEVASRWADAAEKWRGLMADARAPVAQEASLRAAKAFRALGRPADALAAVDAGLRKSSANTPVRSALYALRGDLCSALGRAAEAEAAWTEAAKLNAAR